MNILVIGSGGREHALCWKIQQSPLLTKLYCAPGNGGIEDVASCVNLDSSDHEAVISFCQTNKIDLVVVGPEAPLVNGLVDDLDKAGISSFGPNKFASQLEGSKGFTKDICAKYNIPTAAYQKFQNSEDAVAYIKKNGAPIVIKADGLAAGKGVIVAMSEKEAIDAVNDMFAGSFGDAGAEVVIEAFLEGEEASFFAFIDGENILPLATAQDHKRVGDGDTGPNTGGMGAYSPAPVMTDEMCDRTINEIIKPTVQALKDMGAPYKGVLFAGLMITDKGPELIEYNCRFGDPECQVLMTRLESDILPVLMATAEGNLDGITPKWTSDAALTVVMAAKGYPGSYEKGSVIKNIEAANALEKTNVFQAGTRKEGGQILANGGRVLNVAALGKTVKEAKDNAYKAVEAIEWQDGFYRKDIGWRAL
ncbi:phosphoribosylamine--glycine ligase [Kordiimonas sp. SCSIO 12610]|uniref:phosphoribosylamine--glycine ligase n=1 Tax=Kordiimonas sp. SCSIO 12610 TaxID=2829597 RepID=UPI00210AC100|nr:phosphoribosylamine--glycine ligase [Kordiimonas sp. SCSIO 12610]UTW54877.1 phosphoribosylamine--glycine ligase [Kordiimonas sp. SCSIO 12610]